MIWDKNDYDLYLGVVCPADEVRDGNYSTVSSLVYNNEYLYQDLITYNCQLGFVIEGTEAITQSYSECLSTKQWSELPIHCVGKSVLLYLSIGRKFSL